MLSVNAYIVLQHIGLQITSSSVVQCATLTVTPTGRAFLRGFYAGFALDPSDIS